MSLRVNAKSPEGFRLTITRATGAATLADVESARVEVARPDGTTDTWIPDIESQDAETLVVVYVFAEDASDVPTRGRYQCVAWLVYPGDVERRVPFDLTVST